MGEDQVIEQLLPGVLSGSIPTGLLAVGFILFALGALESRQFKRYLVYIALATLFHKTALIMIPSTLGFIKHNGMLMGCPGVVVFEVLA